MKDDNADTTETSGAHDPRVASLLAAAARRRKAAVGPEPDDLLTIARWVDGELPPERRSEVAARVADDPELRAAIEALAAHDVKGSEVGTRQAPVAPAHNVVSLADRARKSAAEKRHRSENTTGRAASRVLVGGGSVLLLAAILFLATRTTPERPTSLAGASVGAGGTVGLRASLASQAGGACEISGVLSAESPKGLWYVTLEGATSLGAVPPGPFRVAPTCSASACEALVATPVGAPAPALDPVSCAPTDPTLTAVRLTR